MNGVHVDVAFLAWETRRCQRIARASLTDGVVVVEHLSTKFSVAVANCALLANGSDRNRLAVFAELAERSYLSVTRPHGDDSCEFRDGDDVAIPDQTRPLFG